MNWLYIGLAAVLFGGGIFVGRLTVEVPMEKAEVKVEQTQVQQEAKQIQTDSSSETQLVKDIQSPPTLIIRQPVWLHPPAAIVSGAACPDRPAEPAATRATDPGPSVDLRPQLADFAKKYEAVIAGCREGARDWPH